MLVVLVTAVFACLAVGVWLARPITYAAEAGALLQDPMATIDGRGGGSKSDQDRYVANQVAVMKSDDVLTRASAHMHTIQGITPLTPGELQRALTIQTEQGSSFVTVHVEADDAVSAKYAADSVVYGYRVATRADVKAHTQAALHKLDLAIASVAHLMAKPNRTAAQQATALALIQQLRARRNRIEIEGQLAGDGVSLFSPADNGTRQGAPLFATLLIGIVLGGLVGCGIAYLLEAVRGRRLAQHGPVGPTPLAPPLRDAQDQAREDTAPTSITGEPGAEPVAQRGRRWA